MPFLILFLIENIIISRFLNKRNMRVASLSHVILFMFLSMYLLFPPYSSFLEIKEFFISEDIYTYISEVINDSTNISYFTLSISSIVSLVMLVMLIISAAIVGMFIFEKFFILFIARNEEIKKDNKYYCSNKTIQTNKIFKLYCCWRNWD